MVATCNVMVATCNVMVAQMQSGQRLYSGHDMLGSLGSTETIIETIYRQDRGSLRPVF